MAVAGLQRPGAGGWAVFFWVCVQEVQGRQLIRVGSRTHATDTVAAA